MTPERSISEAIDDLANTKAEHRDILARVASDPGMSPETRWALIAHLYDEEDEHVAEIKAALGGAASPIAAPKPTAGTGIQRPASSGQLTVGSLRPRPLEPLRLKGTVGSLRQS